MYTALVIAKYVINKCIEIGKPISNLQLQKILYYIQGEYIRITNGNILFNDTIQAWQYGPVIPDVYYNYNSYSAARIRDKQESENLNQELCYIIDPVICDKSSISAWDLVTATHNENPWRNSYVEGQKRTIPVDEMIAYFVNRGNI